jgi:hypothetical protein
MQADDLVVGDLWVTYEIELRKPVLASNTSDSVSSTQAVFTSPTTANMFSGGTQTIAGLAISFSTNTMTFPLGVTGHYYYECVWVPGTSITQNSAIASILTNCIADGTSWAPGESFMPVGLVMAAAFYGSVNIPDSTKQASVKFNYTATLVGTTSLYVSVFRYSLL